MYMHEAATYCLYSAKLNIAQLVERLDDDLKAAGSSPLSVSIFLPTKFACWHASLQLETQSKWLKRRTEYTG